MRTSREKIDKYNKMISSKKSFHIIYYLCLIGIFSCLLILFFVKTFVSKTVPTLNYKENSTIDYSVKLKPNKYYDTSVLPSGMDYIASLIDTINLKFSYTFTTNKSIDYDATYYIEAITRVYGKDNENILYEKKEKLTEEEKITKKDIMANHFYKEVSVDYDKFNDFVRGFKTSYLLNYDSNVTIVLHVNTTGKNQEFKDINTEGLAVAIIPLTEQTINVNIDSKNINTIGNVSNDSMWANINYIYLSGLAISALADLYSTYLLLKYLIICYKTRNIYDVTLKKILKDYDSIIVNSLDSVDESDYKVLNLSSFDELRDVHDNLGMPIIFNEITPGKVSNFTIAYDNLLYRYTLEAKKLKKGGDKNEKEIAKKQKE